jgi:hypothetical protein
MVKGIKTMKNSIKSKLSVGFLCCVLLIISSTPAVASPHEISTVQTVAETILFSAPVLQDFSSFKELIVPETNLMTLEDGSPMLPLYSKTFEYPLGTHVISVDVEPTMIRTMAVDKPIRPVPLKQKIGDSNVPFEGVLNPDVYESADIYPATWYTYTTGAGLNSNNQHVLFVSYHITPVRYQPTINQLQYSTQFTIRIIVDSSHPKVVSTSEEYPLVIIAPAEFSDQLAPLVTHKNTLGVTTKLIPLESISCACLGRDTAEKIKYTIQDAVETWGTSYVLLVGDMDKLPIRVTYASWWEPDLLSDLYYGDIYTASGDFCSWDANDNNRFGEINSQGNDLDGVDLYPDVHVGRLACTDTAEVTTVVNKIISYEDETAGQSWFNHIILAGGDTFPLSRGAPANVFEGEITNTKVAETLADFTQTYLWTSKHTLHASSFNREINKGAGFVSYAGHGFEHGWGTYRPNAVTRQMIWYYTPLVNQLTNDNKLPVIFFDACLTAKLDFNISDLQKYYPKGASLLASVFGLSTNPADSYTCFGWSFLKKQGGGAIATIGSTRTAYTRVDSSGVYGGAGYMDVHFFQGFHEGVCLGQMMTASQNDYINNVGPDYFTLEEFILLGDPSLRVGGY